MELSERINELFTGEDSILFKPEELNNGQPPTDTVFVDGIVGKYGFHPQRLEAKREVVKQLIKEIVNDPFLKSKNPADDCKGASFLSLCYDRKGHLWGEHYEMEAFLCVAIGLGLAGYTISERTTWMVLPGGMPYVWFDV